MALRVDDVDLGRDRALVERYQAGDAAAFDELYRRYYHRLERFCRKRVGDAHEAEEVAQEAFARALSAMPRLNGERRFYPWVSVIAARLCVDTHRRRGRTTPSAEIDLGEVDGGQERILEAADLDLLRRAMNNLGPRHREVLDLREREGWSYQRIADHYDVSLGTVEALLFRARKALKREFSKLGGERGGFVAGLPVLGWLGRRVAAWRDRLEAMAPNLAPLAGHMSMAVVVGSAAVFAGTHVHGHTTQVRPTEVQAAAPAAATPAAAAPATAATGAAESARSSSTASQSVARAAPAVAPAAGPATRPLITVETRSATVGSSDESSTYASDAPVSHNDGHLVAGLDPPAVSNDTVTAADNYVQHTLDWIR